MSGRGQPPATFALRGVGAKATLATALSGGVMVAQESLELFVMVRIHAGQPVFNWKMTVQAKKQNIAKTIRADLAPKAATT